MSTASKIITLLIFGAFFLLIITHPGGFATDALAGGNVLDNTLALEGGVGNSLGTGAFSGSGISYGGH